MKAIIRSKSKVVGFLMLASIIVVAFQNCGFAVAPGLNFGVAKLNGNGTGYDGKPYGSYGDCGSGVELKAKIVVNDAGDAKLIRNDCKDLDQPIAVDPSSIATSMYDNDVFVYSANIFDPIVDDPADVHFTRTICWSGLENKSQVETAVFADAKTMGSGNPTSNYNAYIMSTSVDPQVVSGITETLENDGSYSYAAAAIDSGAGNSAPSYSLNVSQDLQGTVSGSSTKSAIPNVNGGTSKPMGCFVQAFPNSLITLGTL